MLSDHFQYPELILSQPLESELESLTQLICSSFTKAEELNNEPYTSIDDLKDRMANGHEVYVVKQGDELVASVSIIPDDDDYPNSLFFGRLVVDKSWQTKGVGSQVVKAVIEYAKELGRDLITLNFQELDPWLQSYYEKFGFVQEGDPIPWKKLKIIPMKLKISSL